ncbi:hypothetical protein C5167_028330 [Papaver somniferum]|nr:hypothetical protein C5167_028330 [Papaver somniferum]
MEIEEVEDVIQKGIPHHLLGMYALMLNSRPRIFLTLAIQALVSLFLLDDATDYMDDVVDSSLRADRQSDCKYELGNDGSTNNYNLLKELD